MNVRIPCLALALLALGGCRRVDDAGPMGQAFEGGVIHQASLGDPPVATTAERLAELENTRGLYRDPAAPAATPEPEPTPAATPEPTPEPLADLASDDDDSGAARLAAGDDDSAAGGDDDSAVHAPDGLAEATELEPDAALAAAAAQDPEVAAAIAEAEAAADAAVAAALAEQDAAEALSGHPSADPGTHPAAGTEPIAAVAPAVADAPAADPAAQPAGAGSADPVHAAPPIADPSPPAPSAQAAAAPTVDAPISDLAALEALASLTPDPLAVPVASPGQRCEPTVPALLTTPIAQLELVRTWLEDERLRAEVQAPDGSLFTVAQGDRVGADGGRVVEMNRRELVVGEIGFSLDGRAAIFTRVLRLPN
jgi:hypothetical protein